MAPAAPRVPQTPISNYPPSESPWYESTLLWGALGAAMAIVLTVIAALSKDLRWLLFLAWPFFGLTFWSLCRRVRIAPIRWAVLIVSLLVAAVGLYVLNAYLGPAGGRTFIQLERFENGRVDPPGVLLVPDTTDPKWGIALNLHFKNAGPSVAHRVRMTAKMYERLGQPTKEAESDVFDDFIKYHVHRDDETSAPSWIPGEQGWITAEPLSFSVDQVNRVNFGEDTLYVVGRVTYRDGLGNQVYDICQWLQPAKDTPRYEMMWHQCSLHGGQQ